MKRSNGTWLLALFPIMGILAAGIVLFTQGAGGGESRIPAAVTPPPIPTQPRLPTPMALVETPLIDFTLDNLDGESITLASYAGRTVFLNFWATNCEPCKRELPAFQQFAAETGDEAVVLAVNIAEAPDLVRAFLVQQNVTGLDPFILLDRDNAVADRYGIFAIPVTYVIDGTGLIRYQKIGEFTYDEMVTYAEVLAAETQ